jgi:general secretion pathway protein D
MLFVTTIVLANKETININFKNLQIADLIKITSKVINKNILIEASIKGRVDFISNKPVDKDDILNILLYTLQSKGYTIVENEGILRVIRLNDAAKNNAPVYNYTTKEAGIVTEVFNVDNANVDYISSKIRHLISSSAKLVTDKESNAIVVTDFNSNIKTIKKVIELIAQDNQKHIEIIQLKNLQAATLQSEIVNLAKALYNETIEKEKVNILANKDTNSIMIIGKKENVEYLTNYVNGIDKEDSLVAKSVEVISLKNVESKNVVTMLTGIASKNKDPKKPSTDNDIYIASDEESNAIILMGAKDEIKYYKEIIDKLDIDRQQVYVLAKIIEVSEKGTANMGIKYGIEGLKSNSSGVLNFAGNIGGASTVLSSTALSQITIPNVTDGLLLGASINLLKQNSALDVVSEPSLLCINNKESSIYVGETTSIATQTNNGTTTSTSYKREDIGLKLKVKPRISGNEKVTLEITAILEDISKIYDTATIPPDTNKKELSTLAIVNDGESVVLGGLVKNKTLNTEDKVPLFGDIPILGNLFKNNVDTTDKINLVIVITPYIIPKTKDLSYIRNQLSELKLLEDRYTKDLELRLEQKRLDEADRDIERNEKAKELEERKNTNNNNTSDEDKETHEERVKRILGLP